MCYRRIACHQEKQREASELEIAELLALRQFVVKTHDLTRFGVGFNFHTATPAMIDAQEQRAAATHGSHQFAASFEVCCREPAAPTHRWDQLGLFEYPLLHQRCRGIDPWHPSPGNARAASRSRQCRFAGRLFHSGSERITAARMSVTSLPENAALSRQHLVQHTAKRPDVGPLVHRLSPRLFRRHIRRRAEDDALLCGSIAQRGRTVSVGEFDRFTSA